jgi:tetratricopeptide (TPR) repeat protein
MPFGGCKGKSAEKITEEEVIKESVGELIKKKESDIHFEEGNILLDEKNYDEAILEFNEAINLDPDFALAYNCRGSAYSSKEDSDKAIADFTKAIELGLESYAFIYYFRAGEYFKIGQYEEAILDYSKSIEIDPNYKGSYLFRSICYNMIGEFDKANADMDKAEKCDPDYMFK